LRWPRSLRGERRAAIATAARDGQCYTSVAVSEPARENPTWIETLREAVRGSEQDFTTIAVPRAVVLLAVPMVLEMSMESLFAVADMYFVAKLGPDAVATIGLTEALLALLYAMAMGLSAATNAVIARRTGERDAEGASVAAVQVIAIATIGSIVLGVLGALFAPSLLALMGASPAVLAVGSGYASTMFAGCATIFLLFVINAAFRGAGDAAMAMRSLWLANGLNIALAPLLIFGFGPIPRMGVTGAAIATTISRGVGVLYQCLVLARSNTRLQIRAKHLRLEPATMRELLSIAWAAAIQTLVETASWLGLVRILSSFGSKALAGYTIAMRVAMFALLPAFGLANAAATLVGQNLGAKEPERAERAVKTVAWYNVAGLGAVSLAFAIVPQWFVGLFTDDVTAAAYAAQCLRVVALGFAFFGYGMVVVQAFNGAGDSKTPMVLNVLSFWFLKIPLAYVLARAASGSGRSASSSPSPRRTPCSPSQPACSSLAADGRPRAERSAAPELWARESYGVGALPSRRTAVGVAATHDRDAIVRRAEGVARANLVFVTTDGSRATLGPRAATSDSESHSCRSLPKQTLPCSEPPATSSRPPRAARSPRRRTPRPLRPRRAAISSRAPAPRPPRARAATARAALARATRTPRSSRSRSSRAEKRSTSKRRTRTRASSTSRRSPPGDLRSARSSATAADSPLRSRALCSRRSPRPRSPRCPQRSPRRATTR
jgi:putative MATE family efflux protein